MSRRSMVRLQNGFRFLVGQWANFMARRCCSEKIAASSFSSTSPRRMLLPCCTKSPRTFIFLSAIRSDSVAIHTRWDSFCTLSRLRILNSLLIKPHTPHCTSALPSYPWSGCREKPTDHPRPGEDRSTCPCKGNGGERVQKMLLPKENGSKQTAVQWG